MESDEKYFELVQRSIYYRGQILHLMTVLEAMINTYIVNHFCPSDESLRKDMQLLFLGDERITLNNKAQIFLFLVNSYNKSWGDSFISNRMPEKGKKSYKLSSDLMYLIEQRNIFAHRILDHSDNLNYIQDKRDNSIRLVALKNEIKPLDYTEDDFLTLSKMIADMTSFIAKELISS